MMEGIALAEAPALLEATLPELPPQGPSPDVKDGLLAEPKAEVNDGTSSELSDPDEDVIIGDIEPDHYYENGRVPVFKPTMDQFRNFSKFIEKIDKYGMKSGIVKVIPPAEWRESLPDLKESVKEIKVKNPIKQEFNGNQGVYRQLNMEQPRSYDLPGWKNMTEMAHNQPPARRGERRRNQERVTRNKSRPSPKTTPAKKPAKAAKAPKAPLKPGQKRGPGRPRKIREPEVAEAEPEPALAEADTGSIVGDAPPTPTSPEQLPVDLSPEKSPSVQVTVQSKINENEEIEEDDGSPDGDQPKTVASRRKYNKKAAVGVVDEAAFEGFDYRIDDAAEYTAERCEELERSYWKGLLYSSPLYGADMPGSLFSDDTKEWNVAKLDNLLNVLGQKVPGVNTAYLYLGMWKSTFAWHLEDVDLYSINYIHFGAPKQWYSISQEDARKFEAAMRNEFHEDAKKCSQFLRHKSFLISPTNLKSQYGIEVNRLVHHEGEFVITFPYGYHSGYNIGYNCAESVNFATNSWLEYGKLAKKCECESDSVWVDVWDIERKLRGEETEYEESDVELEYDAFPTDMPTPPDSIGGKRRGRKRKAVDEDDSGPSVKRIRVKVKTPREAACVLCPNDFPHEQVLPTSEGKRAHALCALYVPETYISGDKPQEIVYGVPSIDKARMGLKCVYCRSNRGACFQCSYKKCTRSYHATCAAPAGVLVDRHEIPVYLDDGKEYKDIGVDFRCRFHRTRRSKTADHNSLENSKSIMQAAQMVAEGEVIQIQFLGRDIIAGVVIENRRDEGMFLIDTLPTGGLIEIEHKFLLVLDPEDSQMPYPSDLALPLPADQADRNYQSEPQPQEVFGEPGSGLEWAEFQLGKQPRNPSQAKIDIFQPNQFWHYLGSTSTEGKAEYTSDPARPYHDRNSHFLTSVREPKASQLRPGPNTSTPDMLAAMNLGAGQRSGEKPYIYKPRHPQANGSMPPPRQPKYSREFLASVLQYQRANPHKFPPPTPARPAPVANMAHAPSPGLNGAGTTQAGFNPYLSGSAQPDFQNAYQAGVYGGQPGLSNGSMAPPPPRLLPKPPQAESFAVDLRTKFGRRPSKPYKSPYASLTEPLMSLMLRHPPRQADEERQQDQRPEGIYAAYENAFFKASGKDASVFRGYQEAEARLAQEKQESENSVPAFQDLTAPPAAGEPMQDD